MFTRSDIITPRHQVDVNKALEPLTMFKEAENERIDVRTLLDEAAPKIKDYHALLERLKKMAEGHETCNHSEFAAWLGVSRQTVYTWYSSNSYPQTTGIAGNHRRLAREFEAPRLATHLWNQVNTIPFDYPNVWIIWFGKLICQVDGLKIR